MLAWLARLAGDREAAVRLGQQALQMAERGADDLALERVLQILAVIEIYSGRGKLPFELIDRALAIRQLTVHQGAQRPSPLQTILQVDSPTYLRGLALLAIGNLDEA